LQYPTYVKDFDWNVQKSHQDKHKDQQNEQY
jgi:hypothetical protein